MADNFYFTLAENDTLRISPNALGFYLNVPVIAEFDNGVCDHWRLDVTYPNKLSWIDSHHDYNVNGPDYGMNIPYIQSDGSAAIYEATLTTILEQAAYNTNCYHKIVECSTTVQGYWDYNNDGVYESYGLVKWGPGHYSRMFDIHFYVNSDCTGDSVVIDGLMTCTYDWRYPTSLINTQFLKVIYLIVAYDRGDVNGDGVVSLADVTALGDYLVSHTGLNQYQLVAADVNGDGYVSIGDVGALIDLMLDQGTNEIEGLEDM